MSIEGYIRVILNKYSLRPVDYSTQMNICNDLALMIRTWAGDNLIIVKPIGSFAKKTGIVQCVDLDLFISLNCPNDISMDDIYDGLYSFLRNYGFNAQKQNVSINISYRGYSTDLIPARKQKGFTHDHTIYSNKSKSWIKTNVQKQIDYINRLNLKREIILAKVWRELNHIEFPSYYLELSIVESLKNIRKTVLAGVNFMSIMDYLSTNFEERVIVDISNTNNCVSDGLTKKEKAAIANAARQCLQLIEIGDWTKILR